MGHHQQRFPRPAAEGLDDAAHEGAAARVQPVQRLVQDQQRGVLDEGAGQEAQALLAAGEGEERTLVEGADAKRVHPPAARLQLLRLRTAVEPDAVVQAAGHDVQRGEVLQVGAVHLGADVADVPLDVPDALARAPLPPEEGDVAGVGLGIVGTDQAEERRLPCPVLAGQGPALAPAHHPVQTVQDGAAAVADADPAEAHHLVRPVVRLPGRQARDAPLRVPVRAGRQRAVRRQVVRQRHLGQDGLVRHGDDVRDERRDVLRARHHEDHLYHARPRQFAQQLGQHLARRGVQPDERIVHDEHPRRARQGLVQLETAHLAAGEQEDALVHQLVQAEQFGQAGGEVRVGGRRQEVAHRGDFVLVVRIPALLVVIVGIGAPVGIAEGNVLHIII